MEEKLKITIDTDRKFQELNFKYQEVCQLNVELEEKNEEIGLEIIKRDRLVNDWQETLQAVNKRILAISEENEGKKL